MDTIKNIVIVIGILGGLTIGGLWLYDEVQDRVSPSVGALSGPDIPSSYLQWGGVATYQFSQSMTQNASTTCNWQTPAATSTVRIAARFSLASTSAVLVEMGKSAGPQATTTKLGEFTVGAGAYATLVSSSTQADFGGAITWPFVAAPSTWLAVKIGGGGTGSVPTGTCNFSAETLP
jgi:hypothetical protein